MWHEGLPVLVPQRGNQIIISAFPVVLRHQLAELVEGFQVGGVVRRVVRAAGVEVLGGPIQQPYAFLKRSSGLTVMGRAWLW